MKFAFKRSGYLFYNPTKKVAEYKELKLISFLDHNIKEGL